MRVGEVVDGLQVQSIRESSHEPDENLHKICKSKKFLGSQVFAVQILQILIMHSSSGTSCGSSFGLPLSLLTWTGSCRWSRWIHHSCSFSSGLPSPPQPWSSGNFCNNFGFKSALPLRSSRLLLCTLGSPAWCCVFHNPCSSCQLKDHMLRWFHLDHHNLMQQGHNFVSGFTSRHLLTWNSLPLILEATWCSCYGNILAHYVGDLQSHINMVYKSTLIESNTRNPTYQNNI